MNKIFKLLLASVCLLLAAVQTEAQTNLSVQGTVQEFDGSAVENGNYDITFKLYEVETGGTAVWSETQSVRVTGGVYSVLLGEVTPLTAAFNTTYFLGITLPGGPELFPRSRLTSSPYALSLIGQDNIFPSTGAVGAGTASPTAGYQLHAKNAAGDGKVLVEGSANAKVELQSTDGAEIEFKKGANSASITYDGTNINIENLNLVFSAGLSLPAGQTISYNGLADWRLVDVDDFESTNEGWVTYNDLNVTSPNATAPILLTFSGANKTQKGKAVAPPNITSNMVLKKLIDLTGIPHTQVKIKCTIYPTGSPDGEYIFTAVAPAMNTIGAYEFLWWRNYSGGSAFHGNYTFSINMGSRTAGESEVHEFVIPTDANSFAFIVGAQMNEAPDNESFMIDNVEIWVK